MRKVLDDGRWYVKIDTPVQLNKTGLYTFELIAEDLRAPGRRCPLMHYTVEVQKSNFFVSFYVLTCLDMSICSTHLFTASGRTLPLRR
jgi:hypothetical protein